MKSIFFKTAPCIAAAALFASASTEAKAESHTPDFNKSFCDSTLRVDYILAGDAENMDIFLHGNSFSEGWAGRRVNLSRPPYTGDGMIVMTDSLTGDTIYAHSFSTLFYEWRSIPEAKEKKRAFQNSFLLPLPRRAARISASLLDEHHKPVAAVEHLFSPGDILVAKMVNPGYESRYIRKGGDPENTVDVAFLAEGYAADEMDSFYKHAAEAVEAILSHEPFKSRPDAFNFIAVASPSLDSGVSVPKDNVWKNTAFGSHYSTFYSDRYLTTSNVFALHDALAGIPYEHIIVLANSPVYGGGGIYNSYTLTTTGNKDFAPVVVHEFGHSFGGLADEYFYETDVMSDLFPLDVEPWQPNITTLVDFPSKWKHLLSESTPVPTPVDKADLYPLGVYEGGAYTAKGVYRPSDDCRMRTNNCPEFCPACRDALSRLIDFYLIQK